MANRFHSAFAGSKTPERRRYSLVPGLGAGLTAEVDP